MLNFHSTQTNLSNPFRYDERVNGLCDSQIKIDKNSLSTMAYHRLPQISLPIRLASQTCSFAHKFKKTTGRLMKRTSEGQLAYGDFLAIQLLYQYLKQPASNNSHKKSHHGDHIPRLRFDEVRNWDWHCNQVNYYTRNNIKMKRDEVSGNDQAATNNSHSL